MPASHARATAVTSTDEQARDEVPGLLEVLARVPDPRRKRGRRFLLVFILAVAVACVLAGAKNFREIGDQARDLPQEVLARLGGRPHPLRRKIIAPSEKRIRTLIHELDADAPDDLVGAGCARWRTRGGWTGSCGRSRSTGNDRDLPAVARPEDGGTGWRMRARHRLHEPETAVDRASDEDVVALLRACCSAREGKSCAGWPSLRRPPGCLSRYRLRQRR